MGTVSEWRMTRILVADDVKLFRHLEANVLGWRGYTIEEAANGTEALQKIRANPPDLALVDLHMPGITGHELCRQIKQDPNLRATRVIIITSSNRDEDIRQAVQAGCDDFLTKPLDDTSLLRKVEDLLGSGDKRRFPRITTSLQVSFEDFKGIFFEYTHDISRTGIFIEMNEPLPVGTRLKLSFSLPSGLQQPVLAYGQVVRRIESSRSAIGGIGIRFIHIDSESRTIIDQLVSNQKMVRLFDGSGVFSRLTYHLEDAGEPLASAPVDATIAALEFERDELRSSIEELQRDHLRLSSILALTQHLHAEITPQSALSVACDALYNLLGISSYGIFLREENPPRLVPISSKGLLLDVAEQMTIEGPLARAVQERAIQTLPVPWPVGHSGVRLLAVAPLVCGERVLGMITVHELFRQKATLNQNDYFLLDMLGKHLAAVLLNTVARGKFEKEISIEQIRAALKSGGSSNA
jgi:Response regulator containing CheY-like receiver domain and AraC-type DNA-binding domain